MIITLKLKEKYITDKILKKIKKMNKKEIIYFVWQYFGGCVLMPYLFYWDMVRIGMV